ncbi:glycine-rich protein-like [Anopheles ziemanni]|uniref:glycine-rich protein-like n=1 Tax=Anopheles coustani TaxID=139045 RepID=UPI00265A194B|nr:glycine-rich protein-like [Anopheles coustani]XP_058177474.1 glycine-rich protein-like [Anopheles ziemanni]
MKIFIATIALVLLAIAEASYLPYGGGLVSSYATTGFPVTSSVAYPSYGLYGKSVLPLATKYSYPAVYNSYPVSSKVVTYAAPATVYGGAKIVGYGAGYGAGYGFGAGYGYGADFAYGYGGKVLPTKYYY